MGAELLGFCKTNGKQLLLVAAKKLFKLHVVASWGGIKEGSFDLRAPGTFLILDWLIALLRSLKHGAA